MRITSLRTYKKQILKAVLKFLDPMAINVQKISLNHKSCTFFNVYNPGGGGVLDLNLYADVTTKNFFTLLQCFCLQITPCSRKNR